MLRKAFGVLLFIGLAAAMSLAQQQEGYLDVYVAHVKPEKRAEFDIVNKKMAEANRRHNGDTWLALETAYGEQNTVSFSSARTSYAEVEKGFDTFKGALDKAFGEAGAAALLQQFNNTLVSSRTEIRQRRWDLSYNPPADAAAYIQAIGKTRWIRSVVVRVRPGHTQEFEAELKEIATVSQKSNQPGMRWVSQVTSGGNPSTYVLTRLLTHLDELDHATPMQEMLGEEGYQRFQKMNAEAVAGVEYVIFRVVPELSNPPAEIVATAPDFWNPKPKAAATPKSKAAETSKPAAKEKP
jgi:quinol monooxygenase YgiN